MNQLSKENINLVRLINRLDKNTHLHVKRKRMPDCLHHHPPETPDADHQLDHEHFDHQRYWELKGLETTIRHARSILDTINSNPSTLHTISQIQDPAELRKKLETIRNRIDVALRSCPAPTLTEPTLTRQSALMYKIKTPELPSLPDKKRRSLEAQETPSKEEGLKKEEKRERECSEKEEKRAVKKTTKEEGAQQQQRVLSNQEELTDELSQMALQLKKNVHHFNKLLADDQAVLLANQTKLELNSDTMNKEGGRLTQVSLKSRSMTWFTIAAVCAVAVSWILMFIIIRLT
ncbi:hypothetical protein PCANC_05725 [Puccinia coronata f. sp. avenae]|uniref:Uncharacterized protein n=1 Tax=Puccinia coronata f. sp. avenae TaxID=200324 RepID=A0A2N5TDK1_9BASI|nr:hypothetical protein PCASD_09095 [Puccinia coronata f. sp. avenae]PLW52897.1 hypothetical protein PCANC_05725 [Puccinia coronata f. sp. avenae]